MTLTDPLGAFADESSFVGYLVGLAGLARAVHALAAPIDRRTELPRDTDEFIHLLLGVASLGEAVERLAEPASARPSGAGAAPLPDPRRWLR